LRRRRTRVGTEMSTVSVPAASWVDRRSPLIAQRAAAL
jgi:hypothetical protein